MNQMKTNPEETPELYRLSVLIKQTENAITKARENELKKYGISPEQAAALICIRSLGDRATSAEISRWLFRDESSTLVLIRRMLKQGLIIKTIDSNNKHLMKIKLTSKGFEAYENAIKFLSLYDIFESLTKEKRQQLDLLLEILRSRAFEVLGLDAKTYSGLFGKELILDSDTIAHVQVEQTKSQLLFSKKNSSKNK